LPGVFAVTAARALAWVVLATAGAVGPAVCGRAWLRAWVNSRAEAMAWHGAARGP